MRIHDKPLEENEVLMAYMGDSAEGVTIVECAHCHTVQLLDFSFTCKSCKKIFVYRPWWEW